MAAMPTSTTLSSVVINPDDHGPYVTITAALMLVIMTLFLGIRLAIRWPWNKLAGLDDAATLAATVIGVVQSVAIFEAVHYGLGRHVDELSAARLSSTEKAVYAGNLLFIIALCLSKMAVSLLVLRLTSAKLQRQAATMISYVIIAWGVAGLIAVAVRPGSSTPWNYTHGSNTSMVNVWIGVGAISIAIDFALVIFPFFLVWGLQMPLESKIVVITGFACRLPACAITILRLIALKSALSGPDYPFAIVPTQVYTQIEMHFTILAATIPCMRLFLKNFNTGYLGTTLEQVDPSASMNGTKGSNSYAMSTVRSRHLNSQSNEKEKERPQIKLRPAGDGLNTTLALHEAATDAGSITSDGSDKIIIRKTVEIDYGNGRSGRY